MKIDFDSLTEQGVGLNVILTPKQLINVVDHIIYITKKELDEQSKSKSKEVYLTSKEVCDLLKIDQSTLWRWMKKDYLKPLYIGGKKRYVKSEIDKRFTREAEVINLKKNDNENI